MADGSELLSNADTAKLLGVKEGTIRAWVSRYPEQLREGDHHVTIDKKRFWTPSGVEILKTRVTQAVTKSVALQVTDPVALEPNQALQDATTTQQPDLSLIDSALQPMADQIAMKLVEERLLKLVGKSLHRIIKTPTETDSERIAAALDRVGETLGLIGTSRMLSGGLQDAIKQIQRARTEA